ncbi:MAG: phosphate signaling complex protein PhoU [Planctomycetes bacterium]|nr:phosphate signaling complex protein PhoU [Planctomycetota bacterium]
MHRHFDDQIEELRGRITLMGGLAESMIRLATRMLVERNETHVDDVLAKEEEVNDLQIEVDDRAVKLTALQQPVGWDVRFLFIASRIATDIERIADQAVNICQNVHHLLQYPSVKPLVDLPIMAELAQKMVRDALESFARRDPVVAQRVLEEEKKVDAFKDQVFRELLTYMMSDPRTIPPALSLILVSRNLERVGDHATNIAEEAIYLVQGRDLRHHHEEKTRTLRKP